MAQKINVKFVDLGSQYKSLRDKIIRKFDEISARGEYILADEVRKFENNISSYCQTKHAVSVANGTDALFLSLKGLDIGNGDEVITAPNSFIATAGAIVACGAKPVFVDVRDDYNIDSGLIEEAITSGTKAILPVHLTGRPADMNPIMEIAGKHNLYVIEDAAQAIGACYKGKKVGSFGDAGCFSLHPLKNLHVHGDGGIITTNDTVLHKKLLKLRNHGLKNRDECEFFAYNSRLDSIQAAIGDIKLKHLDAWNKSHRKIASMYSKNLSGVVEFPKDKEYEEPVHHNFVIQCNKRDKLQEFLLKKGIETKIHYPVPIHLQEASSNLGYKEGDFPVTEAQSKRILSLPVYPDLSNEQIELVISSIKSFYNTS